MTIETNYEKGDTAWTIFENQIHLMVIQQIQIIVSDKTIISYRFDKGKYFFYRTEQEIFPTKEALIASL